MNYNEANAALNLIAKKNRDSFSQEDIAMLNDLKKSSFNSIKSFATRLLPNKQTKVQNVGDVFRRLGQGRAAINYAVKMNAGLDTF